MKHKNGMPACAGMTPVFIVSSLSIRAVTTAQAGVPFTIKIKEDDYNSLLTGLFATPRLLHLFLRQGRLPFSVASFCWPALSV
jgi:hypothetical protein